MKRNSIGVTKVEWHRNGVTGAGFWAVLFVYENRVYAASVFEKPKYVSVLCVEDLVAGDLSGHMRGDVFEKELRAACEKHEKETER